MLKQASRKYFQNVPVLIILPAILSVALFIATIFLLVLPSLESTLLAQRRALIHELTQVAWSTLAHYEKMAVAGTVTREQAKSMAIAHLKDLRYGYQAKDYFWINDMHPRIIMHPYRPDLEGRDVSDFADPDGKKLFSAFVEAVKRNGEGYVDYKWQWMDDPDHIAMKISYVKGFEPWGWVVGTGIYIEDIREEIHTLTEKMTVVCLGILLLVFFLSGIVIWKGIQVERRRTAAEARTRMQQEQLFQAAKMASVGTLVSGVAHEINNPNMSILLNAEALKKIWQALSQNTEDGDYRADNFKVGGMTYSEIRQRIPLLLDDVLDNAGRIRHIVSELKDFARVTPPELTDAVDINAAVEKAAGLTGNLIRKSTDDFQLRLHRQIPTFKGNQQKVEQVIVNLLINACQALENRRQSIAVTTGFEPASGFISVSVRDTGVGIAEKDLPRVTDPFFTSKQSNGNTGLGLAISRRITEDHGGVLWIESTPETGTLVTVRFPAGTG